MPFVERPTSFGCESVERWTRPGSDSQWQRPSCRKRLSPGYYPRLVAGAQHAIHHLVAGFLRQRLVDRHWVGSPADPEAFDGLREHQRREIGVDLHTALL